MSRKSSLEASRMEPVQGTRELISMLKEIIAEQELKIIELQTDLKKWEKKYRDDLNRQNPKRDSKQLQKLKEKEAQVDSFLRHLQELQNRHEGSTLQSSRKESRSLEDGLHNIEKLYGKVAWLEGEVASKNNLIEEQQSEIRRLEDKIQNYQAQYQEMLRKAEAYEDKLLAEIKRQQELIRKLKY